LYLFNIKGIIIFKVDLNHKNNYLYIIIFILFSINTSYAQTSVVYPRQIHTDNETTTYPVKLLKLILQYSNENYTLKKSSLKLLQGRALQELEQNQIVDVVWSMTSIQREKNLIPIRIPIYKGLIGARLLLVNNKDASKFNKVTAKKDLLKFYAGQGHDWPDTNILKFNNVPAITGANYEGLFRMLRLDRFNYFPRSIIEIWDEAKVHQNEDIIIDPRLLIHYPTATYFFVNKNNQKLASDLKNGFSKIIKNGKFDKLFYQYHGDFIKKANLENRVIIKLDNPILPLKTPLDKKKLWFQF